MRHQTNIKTFTKKYPQQTTSIILSSSNHHDSPRSTMTPPNSSRTARGFGLRAYDADGHEDSLALHLALALRGQRIAWEASEHPRSGGGEMGNGKHFPSKMLHELRKSDGKITMTTINGLKKRKKRTFYGHFQ